MGGGPATPKLAAAVSEAGGLGSLALGYLNAREIREELAAVRALTARPFAVNLFAPESFTVDPAQIEATLLLLEPLRREVGLAPRPQTEYRPVAFDEQLAAVLEAPPPIVSFTFGLPPPEAVDALRAAGCRLIGTATTPEEARAVAERGFDAVCAQGAEAGAHRGSFLERADDSPLGTLALVPSVVDAVDVPVIAAGAVTDGRGLAAVLALGAGAAQIGTAFLRCPEAGTHPTYRRALQGATGQHTVLTRSLTGKLARGLRNRLVEALAGAEVPPYPVMHGLTAELRRAAAAQGKAGLMSLWAGQGVALAGELGAGEIVELLSTSAAAILRECTRNASGE
jgi:nitronate monooxygenase